MSGVDATVLTLLRRLAAEHPAAQSRAAATDAELRRTAFQLSLLTPVVPRGGIVCDIGGGIGFFSVGCAALGYRTILIDDFRDPVNEETGPTVLEFHRSLGVTVIERDVVEEGLGIAAETLDGITSFDSIEHWHHSPRAALHEAMGALRPGGVFVLGVPNCVNLRKRITVPLGRGRWSSLAEWYDRRRFRGHVRELDVSDLGYIAHDIGLTHTRILGRNWLGYRSGYRVVRALTPAFDLPLRVLPSLCSDLYLVGHKPHANSIRIHT
jgi:SAM-dependent methyltransferase